MTTAWASRAWKRLRYPEGIHAWRWRLLGTWIVAFSLIVAWSLNKQNDTAQRSENLAVANRAVNIQQQRTIRALCDDLYIIDNLVVGANEATRMRLADHRRRGLEDAARADAYLIRSLDEFHRELVAQLTERGSPCVSS